VCAHSLSSSTSGGVLLTDTRNWPRIHKSLGTSHGLSVGECVRELIGGLPSSGGQMDKTPRESAFKTPRESAQENYYPQECIGSDLHAHVFVRCVVCATVSLAHKNRWTR